MKKIYTALFLIIIFAACKSTLPIAMHPDKSTFNSGTIGSVNATNNVSGSGAAPINYKDTSIIKTDTVHHNFH